MPIPPLRHTFRSLLQALATCALVLGSCASVWAQASLQDYFKNAQFNSATLSPNGKYLATTANIGGRSQLAVVDVETGVAKNVAGYETLDVTQIRWLNDERILYSIIAREGEQSSSYSGLYAIHRDGSQPAVLMDSPELILGRMYQGTWLSEPRWMTSLGWALDDDNNALLGIGHFPNRDALPYRVDARNGKRREVEVNVTGSARGYWVDSSNQIRVVTTANRDGSQITVWYRDKDSTAQDAKAWRALSTHSPFAAKFSPLGFGADDHTLIVSAPTSEGRLGVFEYDLAANKPGKLLASDKLADVGGGLIYAPDTRRLLGLRLPTEPLSTLWLDKGLASLQAGLDKALPGVVNVIHPGNAGAAMLVYSFSSTNPGHYRIYHPDKKKLQNLFATRPWIEPSKMAVQLVYDYTARDGLQLMAYLTLPQGREAKALPMVVLVHGGPWARDGWGFSSEVQWLASMGYAVLQPQFRGSTGFGDAAFKKSFGQWGLSMQDDVSDGLQSLVKQGLVDPKRVCIMGASYGGYATMMGLVKDPDQYRCGVNLFGVTNLFYHSSAGREHDRVIIHSMNTLLGDPDLLRDQFTATSPAKQADKIKAPVFMAYGEKDRRVPIIHGEEMRDGLKKHGKVFEYMELEKEEHGIAKEETRFNVYGAIGAFLKKHNPSH